jgi:hypothetical protein
MFSSKSNQSLLLNRPKAPANKITKYSATEVKSGKTFFFIFSEQ